MLTYVAQANEVQIGAAPSPRELAATLPLFFFPPQSGGRFPRLKFGVSLKALSARSLKSYNGALKGGLKGQSAAVLEGTLPLASRLEIFRGEAFALARVGGQVRVALGEASVTYPHLAAWLSSCSATCLTACNRTTTDLQQTCNRPATC
jgi:hypothetical protein